MVFLEKTRVFSAFFAVFVSAQLFALDAESYRLDNGLQVVIAEDHKAPILHCQVWYKIGSSDEESGRTGLSHVLEHMMFQGTEARPDNSYSQIINGLGGSYNAATSSDYTYYYAVMPSDKLELCLDLESDRMRNLAFNPDDFVRERGVVQEERRMRIEDSPLAKAREQFTTQIYPTGGYHHPVIGWMDEIGALSKDDVYDWYHRWYAPNNAVLVLSGDIDTTQAKKWINQYFAKLKPSTITHEPAYLHQPIKTPSRQLNTGSKMPMLMLGYQVPSWLTRQAHQVSEKELAALDMLVSILSQGASSRMDESLVRQQKVATSASMYFSLLQRGDTTVTAYLTPVTDGLEKSTTQIFQPVLSAFDGLIEELKTQPVSENELSRIKMQTIAALVYKKDSLRAQTNELGSLSLLGLNTDFDADYMALLKTVTAKDVQNAAQKFLVNSKRTVAYIEAGE